MNNDLPNTESGATGNGKETVTERMASVAHDTVDRVADRAAAAEDTIQRVASDSSAALEDKIDDARESVDNIVEDVRRYARAQPLAATGIAFAAGAVISLLLRR